MIENLTLTTDSFELIPATPEFLRLLVAGDSHSAGRLLGVVVPDGWPDDLEAQAGLSWHLRAIEKDSDQLFWRVRLIVLRSTGTVIGSINLKGLPDESGTVEIGWGVSEEFRRRGIATRAAQEVMAWVFSQPGVNRIIATISPDNLGSQRVAERLGMRQTPQMRRELPVWEKENPARPEDL